jgi:Caspase domain
MSVLEEKQAVFRRRYSIVCYIYRSMKMTLQNVSGMPRWAFAVLMCTMLTVFVPSLAQAPGDLRIALVIGNAAYAGNMVLTNPANDAKAMSDTLRGLGFTVVEVRDGSKVQIAQAIVNVKAALQGKQAIGMLYYAGHGLQFDWRNFMVPIDARLKQAADIPAQTVDIGSVLDAFKLAGNRMNIVVLDACRDNPFGNQLATKGLAPVDAPPGTFMAFATAAGNVAEDGDAKSANGLYTQYLLQELKKPAARMEDIFKRVKLQVREQSKGRQIPSDSSNLDEDFSFDKGFSKAAPESDSVRLARYNTEKSEWDRIKESNNANDFFGFLQRYPSGFISEIAQFRADQLQRPGLQAQGRRDGLKFLASGVNRFKLGDTISYEVIDGFRQAVTERYTNTVTAADDQRVVMNGGEFVFDQMGGLLKNRFGEKSPAILQVPADIDLGKKWRSAFTNTNSNGVSNNYYEFKVLGLEDLDTPMGKITTFKVEASGEATGRYGRTVMTNTIWIDPRVMLIVRNDRHFRENGRVTENSSTRIVATNKLP